MVEQLFYYVHDFEKGDAGASQSFFVYHMRSDFHMQSLTDTSVKKI